MKVFLNARVRFRFSFSYALNFRVPRLALDVVTGGEEEIVRFALVNIYYVAYNLFFYIKNGLPQSTHTLENWQNFHIVGRNSHDRGIGNHWVE